MTSDRGESSLAKVEGMLEVQMSRLEDFEHPAESSTQVTGVLLGVVERANVVRKTWCEEFL